MHGRSCRWTGRPARGQLQTREMVSPPRHCGSRARSTMRRLPRLCRSLRWSSLPRGRLSQKASSQEPLRRLQQLLLKSNCRSHRSSHRWHRSSRRVHHSSRRAHRSSRRRPCRPLSRTRQLWLPWPERCGAPCHPSRASGSDRTPQRLPQSSWRPCRLRSRRLSPAGASLQALLRSQHCRRAQRALRAPQPPALGLLGLPAAQEVGHSCLC